MWQPSLRLERPEVEWLSLSFVHCHRNRGGRRTKHPVGECWNEKFGTIVATLKGEGVIPEKGKWVEVSITGSALRTLYVIDIGSWTKTP